MNPLIVHLAVGLLIPFLASSVFFVSFMLSFRLLKFAGLLFGQDLPLLDIVELLFFIVISFLPLALPLSLLFATLYTTSRWVQDSEFVAMRSFGLSKEKIYAPLFIVAFLIALGLGNLSRRVIPLSEEQFRQTVASLASSAFLADLKSGQFFTEIPGVTIFSETVEEGSVLKKVFIHLTKKNQGERVIMANAGKLIKLGDPPYNIKGIQLHLFDGNMLDVNEKEQTTEKILFESYKFPITQASFHADVGLKPTSLTSQELSGLVAAGEEELKAKGLNQKTIGKIFYEYYNRFNLPIICLLFSLLGFTFGVYNVRGGKRNPILLTLVVLILYYGLYFGLVSLARESVGHMSLAVFGPTTLLGLFGLWRFKQVDWAA